MKVFRLPAAHTSKAFARFERTVERQLPRSRMRKSMNPQQVDAFDKLAKSDTYGVWALCLTADAKNVRVWNAIEPHDMAIFYTNKRFTHYAKIVFKWQSDTIESIAGWGHPKSGKYSLAFALEKLQACDLGAQEYCALVDYRRVPVHSDFHTPQKSAELFEALKSGFTAHGGEGNGLTPEGELKYRVQQFRERSDGNRLRVLEVKGAICEACGFDFAAQYGASFQPSAHVHHKNPLALGERQAESIDEFAVLCAPCHTAAHMGPGRKLKPWTVEELRSFIRSRWNPRDN